MHELIIKNALIYDGTGTFPRYLGRYIRDREILFREKGLHRITGHWNGKYIR